MAKSLVLAFHGVGAPRHDVPAAELPYWMAEVPFAHFVARAPAAAREMEIDLFATFDDGNRSDLDIAAPLLKENGVPGAFFPCAGRLSHAAYLSPIHLRQVAGMGFEVGSHGFDHVPWTGLDDAQLKRETADSKKALEDAVGARIVSAAIPFGAYNRRVIGAIMQAGYRKIYCSDRGFARQGDRLMMRWSYRTDEDADIGAIAGRYGSFSHRAVTAVKNYLKAHR